MKSLRVLFLTMALATIAAVASAGSATPQLDRREFREEARIRQGVRSGELTRGEAMRLRRNARRIDLMEMRAHRNDRVSMRERERIARAENRLDRRIFRLKHNRAEREF